VNIEIFALCEFAEQPEIGDIALRVPFDTLLVDRVPCTLDQRYIALRLRFQPDEAGDHVVAFHIADPDGREVYTVTGTSPIVITSKEDSATLNLVLRVVNVPLATFGRYAVVLSVDDRELCTLPLRVRQRSEP